MKIYKGLSLYDQKVMVENLFIWDVENGDKPNRQDYRAWILSFFTNQEAIRGYMDDLMSDIELSADDDDFDLDNEGYKRQIEFLRQFLTEK